MSVHVLVLAITVITLQLEKSHSNDLRISLQELHTFYNESRANHLELEDDLRQSCSLYEKTVSSLVSRIHLVDRIDEAKQTIINNQDEVIENQKKEIEHLRTMLQSP